MSEEKNDRAVKAEMTGNQGESSSSEGKKRLVNAYEDLVEGIIKDTWSAREALIKKCTETDEHNFFAQQEEEYLDKVLDFLKAETGKVMKKEDVLTLVHYFNDFNGEMMQGDIGPDMHNFCKSYGEYVTDKLTKGSKDLAEIENKLIMSHVIDHIGVSEGNVQEDFEKYLKKSEGTVRIQDKEEGKRCSLTYDDQELSFIFAKDKKEITVSANSSFSFKIPSETPYSLLLLKSYVSQLTHLEDFKLILKNYNVHKLLELAKEKGLPEPIAFCDSDYDHHLVFAYGTLTQLFFNIHPDRLTGMFWVKTKSNKGTKSFSLDYIKSFVKRIRTMETDFFKRNGEVTVLPSLAQSLAADLKNGKDEITDLGKSIEDLKEKRDFKPALDALDSSFKVKRIKEQKGSRKVIISDNNVEFSFEILRDDKGRVFYHHRDSMIPWDDNEKILRYIHNDFSENIITDRVSKLPLYQAITAFCQRNHLTNPKIKPVKYSHNFELVLSDGSSFYFTDKNRKGRYTFEYRENFSSSEKNKKKIRRNYGEFNEENLNKALLDKWHLPLKEEKPLENVEEKKEQPAEKKEEKSAEPVVLSSKALELLKLFQQSQKNQSRLEKEGEAIDGIADEEFVNPEVLKAVDDYYKENENAKRKGRLSLIFLSRRFKREVEALPMDRKEAVKTVLEEMRSCHTLKELYAYLKTRRLVYIGGYLKIRIRNGLKDRIIFCFGDKLRQNPRQVFIIDCNTKHDFSNIASLHPESEGFEVYGIPDKTEVNLLPDLDKNQEEIASSYVKPFIVTGCAGSGKTLISAEQYIRIYEEVYNQKPDLPRTDLLYLTFTSETRDDVLTRIHQSLDVPFNGMTIEEFLLHICGMKEEEVRIAHLNTFLRYLQKPEEEDHLKNAAIQKVFKEGKGEAFYTYFRGYFKGSLYHWKEDGERPYLLEKEFDDLVKDEPIGKNREERQFIYDLCKSYAAYQKKETMRFFDDNDLARIALAKVRSGEFRERYNYIIIDEVQDLTDVQLAAIVSVSARPAHLFFYGDQNQSIHPTLFRIDDIPGYLYKEHFISDPKETQKKDVRYLNESYRFGPRLAEYINSLVNVRREHIGALASKDLEMQIARRTDENSWWAGYSENGKINDIMIKKALKNAGSAIIVPNDDVRKELVKKYGTKSENRIFTIFEAKGLEWKYVLLYHMLSAHEKEYLEILEDKAEHSTLHRMIFNGYYVGCTRASVCFSVLENKLDEKIEKAFLKDKLNPITENDTDLYLMEVNSPENWVEEGNHLFASGLYKRALYCYRRAKAEGEVHYEAALIMNKKNNAITRNDLHFLRDQGFYKEAGLLYKRLKKPEMEKLMGLHSGSGTDDKTIHTIIRKSDDLDLNDIALIEKTGYFTRQKERIRKTLDEIKQMF